jgi:CubicO group peptidase (beta-lactamase class C family)
LSKWRIFILGFVLGCVFGIGSLLTWEAFKMHDKVHAAERTPPTVGGAPDSVLGGDPRLVDVLEVVRQKYKLPALGGALVSGAGPTAVGVVGERVRGRTELATIDDSWHLGSDSKAMTAMMIAALVEEKKLSWDSRLSDVFPELHLPADKGAITLLGLLSHRAGLPANTDWRALSKSGSLVEQRFAAVGRVGSADLVAAPGSKFSYSNWGYVVAGAMAERVTGKTYEALMQEIIFGPLHMGSAGFGPAGTDGTANEPWGHKADGSPSSGDNPPVMDPAGCIHCSLGDWGRFIEDQLRGSSGKAALLKPESYLRLRTAPYGGNYAFGWLVIKTPDGGTIYTHAGSNTLNLAVAWMAPAKEFAVLVVCNQGSSDKACQEALTGLVAIHSLGGATP